MIRTADKRRFRETIIESVPNDILTTAIEWISSNLNPADIFSDDQLGDSIEKTNLKPEDIFDEQKLIDWAEDNNYEKKSEPA